MTVLLQDTGLIALCFVLKTFFVLPALAAPATGEALYKEHCSVCHDAASGSRTPARSAIERLSADAIVASLESGVMKEQGAALSTEQRATVATYLSKVDAAPPRQDAQMTGYCSDGTTPDETVPGADWNGWGVGVTNLRFQPEPGDLGPHNISKLKLRWAFGFPKTQRNFAQPVVVGGRVYSGNPGSTIYSLDAKAGCIHWVFPSDSPVRAAVTIGPGPEGRLAAYFGDQGANAYAVDALTGEQIWKTKVDDTPWVTITGSPTLHKGRLYVPLSLGEDIPSMDPKYECCKYSGAVVALQAATGEILWTSRTIREPARITGKNNAGTPSWGPSGAAIWVAPTIDEKNNALYVGTGDNHSDPATETSERSSQWISIAASYCGPNR